MLNFIKSKCGLVIFFSSRNSFSKLDFLFFFFLHFVFQIWLIHFSAFLHKEFLSKFRGVLFCSRTVFGTTTILDYYSFNLYSVKFRNHHYGSL